MQPTLKEMEQLSYDLAEAQNRKTIDASNNYGFDFFAGMPQATPHDIKWTRCSEIMKEPPSDALQHCVPQPKQRICLSITKDKRFSTFGSNANSQHRDSTTESQTTAANSVGGGSMHSGGIFFNPFSSGACSFGSTFKGGNITVDSKRSDLIKHFKRSDTDEFDDLNDRDEHDDFDSNILHHADVRTLKPIEEGFQSQESGSSGHDSGRQRHLMSRRSFKQMNQDQTGDLKPFGVAQEEEIKVDIGPDDLSEDENVNVEDESPPLVYQNTQRIKGNPTQVGLTKLDRKKTF